MCGPKGNPDAESGGQTDDCGERRRHGGNQRHADFKDRKPNLRVIAIEPNKFRRDIAKKYVDIVTDPFEAELVIRKATGGAMADQIIECSGNAEVPGILHKYLKDGGWGTDDAPGHIHWQGIIRRKLSWTAITAGLQRTAQFPCPVRWRPAVRSRFLPGSARGIPIRNGLPVEIWPVSKCAEAFEYKMAKGEDVFKNNL